ncbi:hypothetical protein BLOT_010224 [Blomia tropicalis]|nr:hypothetical protein BLOT_010224 [Blomia tropicalis]
MLENATKSLELGVTISNVHQSPLTVAIMMEEDANVDSSIRYNGMNAFKEACNSAYENIVKLIGNNFVYSGLANSTPSYDYGHGNSLLGSTDKRVISAN